MSNEIEEFAMMAKYLEPKEQHLLPQNIDIGNYIPFLNSYAVAALYYEENHKSIKSSKQEPFYKKEQEKDFQDTGIYLYANENYFTIINYNKGGTLKVFDKKTNTLDIEDGGLFGVLENNDKFSTQQFDDDIDSWTDVFSSNYGLTTYQQ